MGSLFSPPKQKLPPMPTTPSAAELEAERKAIEEKEKKKAQEDAAAAAEEESARLKTYRGRASTNVTKGGATSLLDGVAVSGLKRTLG